MQIEVPALHRAYLPSHHTQRVLILGIFVSCSRPHAVGPNHRLARCFDEPEQRAHQNCSSFRVAMYQDW